MRQILARPSIITRRAVLSASAASLIVPPAYAADPVRLTRKAPPLTLSNGDLTITTTSNIWGMCAIDFDAGRLWFRTTGDGDDYYWNNSSTADPGTGTGGRAFTLSGTKYPRVLVTSPDVATLITSTAELTDYVDLIPSGFSSWDALAGSATLWDSGTATASLSNGDLTATGSGYAHGTNGLSSGKAFFAIKFSPVSVNSSSTTYGFQLAGNFLPANNITLHNDPNGTLVDKGVGVVAYGNWQDERDKTAKSTTAITGKKFFAYTPQVSTGGRLFVGIVSSGDNLVRAHVGSGAQSVGYAPTGTPTVWKNGSSLGNVTGTPIDGESLVAVDADNGLVWFYGSSGGGSWHSGSPITPSGGYSFTGTAYPAVSVRSVGDQGTLNFGRSSFQNTAQVAALIGAGYQPMDPLLGRSRGFIFG